MFIYILFAAVAGAAQIGTLYLLKENIIPNHFYATPLILFSQYLFIYAYTNSPSFLTIWFVTTALTSSMAFLSGYFIWGETVNSVNVIGIFSIFLGMSLLRV
ncbi:MAG: hypothetical protein HN790_05535 [Methylococcales bacterium]|nr:hypothetical protein [Methylococcales bacterium]